MASKVYYLIDDTDVSSGKGAGSGQPISPEFVANNDGDAALVGQSFAQLFQRSVRVVSKSGSPPWTTQKGANNSFFALSLTPSGISF